MPDHPTCIDCSTQAPETNSSYTLISATFGWRLTRKVAEDGTRSVEWRCPNCWRAHKEHVVPGGLPSTEARGAPSVRHPDGKAAPVRPLDAKGLPVPRAGTLTERILAKKLV